MSTKLRFQTARGIVEVQDNLYDVERITSAVERIARAARESSLGSWKNPVRLGLPRPHYLRLLWAMHRNPDGVAPLLEEVEFLGVRIYGLEWPYYS